MRRFIARHGYPVSILSDNGTNFHGAQRELAEALQAVDHQKVAAKLVTWEIEWKFNPPAAPHMGGVWERLVRSVNVALAATLKERSPREEVLTTLFAEGENLLNSRPLTHVSTDSTDAESLTPNHFLLGGPNSHLSRRIRFHGPLPEEYLASCPGSDRPLLATVGEGVSPGTYPKDTLHHCEENLKVGDVVVVADDKLPRGCWPKGMVQSTHPGKDGVVRVVDVKTASGIYRRPVVKVTKLDVSA